MRKAVHTVQKAVHAVPAPAHATDTPPPPAFHSRMAATEQTGTGGPVSLDPVLASQPLAASKDGEIGGAGSCTAALDVRDLPREKLAELLLAWRKQSTRFGSRRITACPLQIIAGLVKDPALICVLSRAQRWH